jgi:hypothetical protein
MTIWTWGFPQLLYNSREPPLNDLASLEAKLKNIDTLEAAERLLNPNEHMDI